MRGNVTSVASAQAASAYGTYDQGGNVAEWLDTPAERSLRIIGGGHYGSDAGEVSSSGRSFQKPDYVGPSVGFRIVRSHCPADLDGDGNAGAADAILLASVYGMSPCSKEDGGHCRGDFNFDGDVDGLDLAEFSLLLESRAAR